MTNSPGHCIHDSPTKIAVLWNSIITGKIWEVLLAKQIPYKIGYNHVSHYIKLWLPATCCGKQKQNVKPAAVKL